MDVSLALLHVTLQEQGKEEGEEHWSHDGGGCLESEGQEQSRGWMEEMGHGWKERPPPFLNSCSASHAAGSPLLPSAHSKQTPNSTCPFHFPAQQ